jgi:minor extracellular protease Epr
VEKGTLQGFPDGTFCPDAPITRGQMAVLLERLDRLNEAKFEKNL